MLEIYLNGPYLQIQYKVNLKRGKHWTTRSKKQLLLFQFHLSVQTDRSHSNLLLIYISLQITLVNVVVIKVEYSCQNLAFTILYFIDIYAFIHWSIAVFPKLYKLQTKKNGVFSREPQNCFADHYWQYLTKKCYFESNFKLFRVQKNPTDQFKKFGGPVFGKHGSIELGLATHQLGFVHFSIS